MEILFVIKAKLKKLLKVLCLKRLTYLEWESSLSDLYSDINYNEQVMAIIKTHIMIRNSEIDRLIEFCGTGFYHEEWFKQRIEMVYENCKNNISINRIRKNKYPNLRIYYVILKHSGNIEASESIKTALRNKYVIEQEYKNLTEEIPTEFYLKSAKIKLKKYIMNSDFKGTDDDFMV